MFDRMKKAVSKSLGYEDWKALADKGPIDPTEVTQKPKEFKKKLKKEEKKRKLKNMISGFLGRKSGGGKSW